jgi:hypothetical protein
MAVICAAILDYAGFHRGDKIEVSARVVRLIESCFGRAARCAVARG